MSDKSWGAKATRRRTAPSPGQPHLPRIRPQSLAGRAGQVALVAKNPPANTGDRCKRPRFDPWVGMIPWRGNGNPLQRSSLGNPVHRGACWAAVHGVAKSQTRLRDSAAGEQPVGSGVSVGACISQCRPSRASPLSGAYEAHSHGHHDSIPPNVGPTSQTVPEVIFGSALNCLVLRPSSL